MADTGYARFPGGLDPRAAEFRPTYPFNNTYHHQHQLPPFVQQQIYYNYTYPGQQPYPQFTAPPLIPVPPPPAYVSTDPPPCLPPPSVNPSRTILLSSVPHDVSESTVRRELEVFGDVRAVQMERVAREGIVTVHFYDLRDAKEAVVEIQDQHMQQQFRLRVHFEALLTHNYSTTGPFPFPSSANNFPPPPVPPPAQGLIAGRAVWAQFIFPVTTGIPHGHNQGTIVIFNLDSGVSASTLREIFEPFGAIKELRETPMKRHQRFIEFYDTRNAAKALEEMNGKEICGKNVVIQFSRPGGYTKRFSRNTHSNNNHPWNGLPRSPPQLPAVPMPPSPRKHSPPYRPLSTQCNYNNTREAPARLFPKKGNGKNSGRNGNDEVEAGMGNLCLSSGSGKKNGNGNGKKGGNGTSSVASSTSSVKQYNNGGNGNGSGSGSSRLWKGARQVKDKFDPRFLINEDGIMLESNRRDSRTTVMIKNIPNKYSQKLLLNMLDNHCIHCNEQIGDGDDQPLSSYDFVYLPIDFINKCNVGYGFVNMTTPEATWRLYKAFHHQNWEVFNSRKICEVTYARLQGVEALKEHFKNSKFPSEAEEYMPVVFSPPRDGRTLTQPNPIVARHNSSSSNSSSSSPVTSEDLIEATYNSSRHRQMYLRLQQQQNPSTANSDSSSSSVNHEDDDGVYGSSGGSVCSGGGNSSSLNGGVTAEEEEDD